MFHSVCRDSITGWMDGGTGGSISGDPNPSTTPSQLGGGMYRTKTTCVRSGQFRNLQIMPKCLLQITIKGTISIA